MKLLLKLLLCLSVLIISSCKNKERVIESVQTYQEPEDPLTINDNKWFMVNKGLQASVASTANRFVRGNVPKIDIKTTWSGSAWKGERIAAQMVLWSQDSITKVDTQISDFKSDTGHTLPAAMATIHFVNYVITDEFAQGCGYRKPKDFAASLAADILEPVTTYTIKARETRPVWLTINVPLDAKPGHYKSTLTLSVSGQKNKTIALNLKVIDKKLPEVSDWKFHLDLWQNPYAVSRFHGVEPWSKAHFDLLKPIMKRLANAGQKVITVSLNKRPWGGQTYDPFESMIYWKKKANGAWEYDYTIFDNWVAFMMNLGVNKQISCYSMVPWGNEFYYFDEAQHKEVKIKAAPGTEEYKALWTPFLKDFKQHLVKKGWANITRVAMDERGPDEMKAMLTLLNTYAPEFGVSFADNHKSYKLYPEVLKDLSVAFGHPIAKADLKIRQENGFVSTHYVCCSDKFPNTFTFSPPLEGTFIGWYTMAAGFDGFLRWAYNSWVKHPLQDSRFRAWPAGDTYLVYPYNRSSIRFEMLREGIQDAEKINVLRAYYLKNNKLDKLDYLNGLVAQFNITSKPENFETMLINAKNALNMLAEQ